MIQVSGTFLSDVQCINERKIRAKREGMSISECPIKYGCILFAINAIYINNQHYFINRNTNKGLEERLVLEIGYQLQPNGKYIKEHQHMVTLHHQPYCILTLNRAPYIKTNHQYNVREGIGTYFVKLWANNVIDLVPAMTKERKKCLTPKIAARKLTKPIIYK